MIPILFSQNAREYNNNGLGVLVDVGYCTVTEETNGAFELELEYPVNGSHYSGLAVDCQILAKPNETSDPQAFRIYNISKPMNGVVTVSAEHISYELSSIIVKPFSASNVGEALSKIKSNSIGENPFEFWTDKSTTANMSQSVPLSARSLLGGVSGSVLDTYTGEYEFDNYTVKLHQNRGADNGVVIAYAKNLTGVKCEERSDGIVTGVIGYWTSEDENGNVETVIGDLQTVSTGLSYSRNVAVDFSGEYENKPTKSQLNSLSKKYLNSIKNVPYFSVSVEFVNLGDTEEYKQYKGLYRVKLCDTVTVKHPLYGINVKAKVVKTVFDSVREKYDKIEIGEVAAKISQTIVAQEKAISQKVTLSQLDKAILNATNAITGNKGGYVVLNPPTAPQELLILDKPNLNEAVNVWRWNLAGLGHSGSGYNGDYSLAILADGSINADFITTGTLSANRIFSGTLSSDDGLSYFSLESGNASFGNGKYFITIEKGELTQSFDSLGGFVGGLVPIGVVLSDDEEGNSYGYQSIYYNKENKTIKGVTISAVHDGVYHDVLGFFGDDATRLYRRLVVNGKSEDYRGIMYRRPFSTDDGKEFDSVVSVCTDYDEAGNSTISFDQYDRNHKTDVLRLDVLRSYGEAHIAIRGKRSGTSGGTTGLLELGRSKMWWSGSIYAYDDVSGATITNRSDRKIKKNIKNTDTKNALSSIKSLRIYDYDLKDNGKSVKMGLMADEAPQEILSDDGKGINLYSYCGMLALAVKELSEKVDVLSENGGKNGRKNQE